MGRRSLRSCAATARRQRTTPAGITFARVHTTADELLDDPEIDAVYVATPPSSHCDFALKAAAAGKPCLVEKPMATNHGECLQMIDAFRARQLPLWVAYYRRALPRFLKVRELLRERAIGELTSIHVSVCRPAGDRRSGQQPGASIATLRAQGCFSIWRRTIFDIIDFAAGPITSAAHGFAVNSGRRI